MADSCSVSEPPGPGSWRGGTVSGSTVPSRPPARPWRSSASSPAETASTTRVRTEVSAGLSSCSSKMDVRMLRMASSSVVQRNWPGGRQQALAELERWNEFVRSTAEPLVQAWRDCQRHKARTASDVVTNNRVDIGRGARGVY